MSRRSLVRTQRVHRHGTLFATSRRQAASHHGEWLYWSQQRPPAVWCGCVCREGVLLTTGSVRYGKQGTLWHISLKALLEWWVSCTVRMGNTLFYNEFFYSWKRSCFPLHFLLCTSRNVFFIFRGTRRLYLRLVCGMTRAWEWFGGKSDGPLLRPAVLKMAIATALLLTRFSRVLQREAQPYRWIHPYSLDGRKSFHTFSCVIHPGALLENKECSWSVSWNPQVHALLCCFSCDVSSVLL